MLAVGQVLPTGDTPAALAAADLDGDGNQDLVVANKDSVAQDVYLGQGNGVLARSASVDIGDTGLFVGAGDFDGDGRADLVFAQDVTFSIWKGAGNGTFQKLGGYLPNVVMNSLAIADLNGDGALDLLFLNAVATGVAVLEGDGRGAFGTPATVPTSKAPAAVVPVDFDRDGHVDLAILQDATDDDLGVMLGNGDGTFGALMPHPVPGVPLSLAAADFDGDGNPDLVAANCASKVLSVLLGDGRGGFGTPSNIPAPGVGCTVVTGDFDGDGITDLATQATDGPTEGVRLWLGDGHGGFASGQRVTAGNSMTTLIAVDLDGDGHPDIAVIDSSAFTLTTLLSRGQYRCQ
jgi:hypothetical protein